MESAVPMTVPHTEVFEAFDTVPRSMFGWLKSAIVGDGGPATPQRPKRGMLRFAGSAAYRGETTSEEKKKE